MFLPHSTQLTTEGLPLRLHLLSIGMVRVKNRYREPRIQGILSMVDFVLDRHFTEWMPIWVLVIEHPEGIFVIDTGERAAINDPNYFRTSGMLESWFDTTQFKFSVRREEEIDEQLKTISIRIADVKAVVLTHLHFDHTDGLYHFPETPVLVSRLEWEKPFGNLPRLLPSWFKPTLLELDKTWNAFQHVHYLTASRDLALVHTPGHTFGHCSVLLKTDSCHILFAADICYNQEQFLKGKFAANSASPKMSANTYAAVSAYAAQHPLIFLPSHDPEAGLRLERMQPLPIEPSRPGAFP